MSGILIDTNILVYAFENRSDPKVAAAKAVFENAVKNRNACLSTQNLTEFASVSLKKAIPKQTARQVGERISSFAYAFRIYSPSALSVANALLAVETHQLSFWDAMLWAVAKENGVSEILTEDFQDGQIVEGVTYRNPLKTA